MSSFSGEQARLDAQRQYASRYPFEPYNGGDGIDLECTTGASTSLALIGSGDAVVCTNWGSYPAFVQFTVGAGTATQARRCILPGVEVTYTLPAGCTHANGISVGGDTNVNITRGTGN